MAKRVSKIADTLKQLGDIQVTDWDFMELMNTEIKDLEISRSLKRLGAIQVMDWDFKAVLPVVKEVANQEVDVVDLFRRTANYKVMDWDFRSALSDTPEPKPKSTGKALTHRLSRDEMQVITLRLKNFLQYVAVNLIDEPNQAQIKVSEPGPDVLRFKLVLVQKDVAMLIGREGHTAAAIRSMMKAAAGVHGVHALLQIHSHEEEFALMVKEGTHQ